MSKKFVYFIDEGDKSMKSLLGGKGANIAEMYKIGLPVPENFTVTTEACTRYYEDGKALSEDIKSEIFENLKRLEDVTGRKFGDPTNPLLVSVRSGAVISMPGMMDTVLNLGLNDEVAKGFAKKIGDETFVYDLYRRFIQMFSDVVLGMKRDKFIAIVDRVKAENGYKDTNEFTLENELSVIEEYKKIVKTEREMDFPQDPKTQLLMGVEAVFGSWNNDRAIYYRNMNQIPHDLGTAVNVQRMVYGNYNDKSGTGVAFTRNPANGEKALYGEYLMNAQGEDIVAGIRTPQKISTLEKVMPDVYKQFCDIMVKLEHEYHNMQDVEFTIEDGRLFMLQTRNGKRTAAAAVKIAVDMFNEGLATKEEALMQIDVNYVEKLLHPTFDEKALAAAKPIGNALPASPGAASGVICLDAKAVIAKEKEGLKPILVRMETSPEDIEGMSHAEGVLTAIGGATSHAAVVARGIGVCCVSGFKALSIDEDSRTITVNGVVYNEGDPISLDGTTGNIYAEAVKTKQADLSGDFATIIAWAKELKRLHVYANADTPSDVARAIELGAEGVGLTRTEHMFFDVNKIKSFRKMILADTKEGRVAALAEILPYQYQDFKGILEASDGKKVSIRLLDPPLHEFLPQGDDEIKVLADELGITPEDIRIRNTQLHEFNPMLGHRGCRLAVTYPEIYEMQVEAILTAAVDVAKAGKKVAPEIMVPLVGNVKEFKYLKELIINKAKEVFEKKGQSVNYKLGTMIEVPRGAIVAGEIAKEADFFSYGTNDLTQMTLGFSRDDATKFINDYIEKGIFQVDPFKSIDIDGVGYLIETSSKAGKAANENLIRGVCGEHGGDPRSITFFEKAGLDYVSCSPYRVPVAIVAAAQAAIENK